jgi:hypothetical protein
MHFKTAYEAQGLEPPAKPSWYKYWISWRIYRLSGCKNST